MTTHEVLVAARNLIDREGWICGQGYRRDEGYCINGALGRALGLSVCDPAVSLGCHPAMKPAVDVLLPLRDDDQGYQSLWGWNDAVCKTKEQALALFDRAIAETAPPPPDPFTAGPVGRASFREPVRS